MAVYYRYRSEVKTFSVPVPGPTVSVGELKRFIMGSARYGHHRDRQSIELYKSLTCEEQYDDDAKPVPLDSTVIACRLPDPPAETITLVAASSPLTPKSAQRHGSSSWSATSPAARSPAAPVLAPPPSIPGDLHCKICSNVMADASECCFWSYCDPCVSDRIAGTSRCACVAPVHSNEERAELHRQQCDASAGRFTEEARHRVQAQRRQQFIAHIKDHHDYGKS